MIRVRCARGIRGSAGLMAVAIGCGLGRGRRKGVLFSMNAKMGDARINRWWIVGAV